MAPDGAWWPLLVVSFGIASFLLIGWGVFVMQELRALRQRMHDLGGAMNGHEGRIYFLEKSREERK